MVEAVHQSPLQDENFYSQDESMYNDGVSRSHNRSSLSKGSPGQHNYNRTDLNSPIYEQKPQAPPRKKSKNNAVGRNEPMNETATFEGKAQKDPSLQQQQQKAPLTTEKIAEINLKLKQELQQLISKLEGAMEKFKARKEKDKMRAMRVGGGGDEGVEEKAKELKQASVRSMMIKKEITMLKRKLETAFDVGNITDLENSIRDREKQVQRIEDQNKQFKKVGTNQTMAMRDLNKEEELTEKYQQISSQLKENRQQIREMQERYKEAEKQLQDQHLIAYDLEEKHRRLQLAIRNRKKGAQDALSKEGSVPDFTQRVEQLNQEIEELQQRKNEEEEVLRRKNKELDKLIVKMKGERDLEDLKMQEREHEFKILDMKVKEVKRQQQLAQQAQKLALQKQKQAEKEAKIKQELEQEFKPVQLEIEDEEEEENQQQEIEQEEQNRDEEQEGKENS